MKYFVFKVMAEKRGSSTNTLTGEVSFSENRNLYDFQPNLMSGLLVSGRARKLIESLEVTNAEWLPVVLKDQEGTLVDPAYAFLRASRTHRLQGL